MATAANAVEVSTEERPSLVEVSSPAKEELNAWESPFEMTQAERAAWFMNSPRHQGEELRLREREEIVDEHCEHQFIDVGETMEWNVYTFDDGSALIERCGKDETYELIPLKCAGISDPVH